jgi:Mycothiol maleylpyruvate isomerase N-terminal domain
MRRAVLGAFLEGVDAIEHIAARQAEDWTRPTPCPEWTAADLVGHVRCASEDYNAVLDCALGGRTDPVLRSTDLAQHNAARLATLVPAEPLVHVAAFGQDARWFAKRAIGRWHTAIFRACGSDWTVGDYVGFCALEWHVHAWDLACSAGTGYHPRCAQTLADWWRDRLPHLPLGADCGWEALLWASGRAPAAAGAYLRPKTAKTA